MKLIAATLLTAVALSSAPAMANLDLAKKSNCMACHAVDKKLVGPAYEEVAKKYKGNKDAVKTLSAKVKAGGSGVWGQIPMPPNAAVKDADIETLVKWILTGAK
jgi:cytochrome c